MATSPSPMLDTEKEKRTRREQLPEQTRPDRLADRPRHPEMQGVGVAISIGTQWLENTSLWTIRILDMNIFVGTEF